MRILFTDDSLRAAGAAAGTPRGDGIVFEQKLLDCVEQAVIATDREDRVIYWNAFAEKLYGWTAAEALGRPVVDITPTPMTRGQAAEILERLKTGESWSGEIELTHRDGTAFPAFVTDSPLFDQNGTLIGVVGISYDLTDQKRTEEELRRRTIQQSTVANLGKIALSGASMTFLLEQAIESIRDVLHLETAAVVEEDRTKTADSGTDAKPFDEGEKGISVPILRGAGLVWGHLGGKGKDATSFARHDIDFLHSVATVISQALERNEAEDALKRRARQQSAIARFGRLVLTSVAADAFEKTCDLLPLGADADFGFYAEVTPANTLRLRAGSIWTAEPSGRMPALATLQAGASLIVGEPVVVSDYRTDERFRACDDAVPYGILSGVMVPVASGERVFGVLSAQSRTANHFRQEDVDFVESLANMLAEALEREIALASIADSEERYRRILDGATEIIFSVDATGRFTSINPAFEMITAWRREEWLGRPFLDIVAARDRQRLEMVLDSILERWETVAEETTIRGRDRDITVEVTAFPKVENGRVVEVYAFARDVTDARRATAERERVTRSLQLLLESTIEGMYTVDLNGRCTMINRAAAAFLGMPAEEVLGRPMHDLLHRDAAGNAVPIDQCPIESVLRSGQPRSIADDFFSRGDGRRIPVAYSAAPILDEGVRVGAVVTFTDLRERRRLEAKLEQITRLSSLGHLAATVAHEFNNVLMGISPFVDVIRRGGSKQRVETALDHIANAVKRGQRITGDILRFTQPAEPMRNRIDLVSWLDALAVDARSVLDGRFALTVNSEPVAVDADPAQLHQTLMNLILNARDAMPAGGTIAIGAIAIDARRDALDARLSPATAASPSHYAHLTVSDTGFGMSEETLRHAFEPLFTTKKNGTGLGLAVAHQVVRRHGGDMLAESTPGLGTTFHIYLPLSVGDATVVAEAAGERPHETAVRHILLVEDDPIVGAGLCELLEYEGFAVSVVDTGRGAIDAIATGALPDAVILDVGLPDMDGTAVFEEIAVLHPELPVIFSTGHADRVRLEDLLSRENVGYLLKPYDSEALMSVLSEVAARRCS